MKKIKLKDLKMHEEFNPEKFEKLCNYYIKLSDNVRIIPTILVDIHTNVIIDGHHRYQLFKKLKVKYIEVSYIDYLKCDNIIVNPNNDTLTKEDVIRIGLSDQLYPPKTTQHMIIINNKLQPIIYLSTNILLG